jgi:hypothetical protein
MRRAIANRIHRGERERCGSFLTTPYGPDALKPKQARKPGGKTIYGVTIADIEKLALPGESYETAAARIAQNRELGLSG